MTAPFPYSFPFDLSGLTDRGAEIRVEPASADRQAIAKWLDVQSVDSLAATVRIVRLSEDRFRYEAKATADVVQSCVITLEPVLSHLKTEFVRDYRLGPGARARKFAANRTHLIADLEAEEPEMLEGTVLDLAAPILEEIGLVVDPYPRAPGASFAPSNDPTGEGEARGPSPFAVLSQLQEKPPKGAGPPGKNLTETRKKPRK